MSNDAGLASGSGSEGAFGVQMRGYSRRQVDTFAARSRSQIRGLEERLSGSLSELERLRTELSAARQALSHKPAQEQVSERVGHILKLAGEEAETRRARAQDEIGRLREEAQKQAGRSLAEAREQAERMVAGARERAENSIAAARAEADSVFNAARADSDRAVSEAAKEAERTLAAARSQANQVLGETTARASAIHDGAERRLSLLTSRHTQAMRQLTQIQEAMSNLVVSITAQGPLEDEATAPAATSPAAGSPGAVPPSAPAAANAVEGSHAPATPAPAEHPGRARRSS
jgi:cell division septum initiation protein DivIVA